jgi:hypothetical protein
MGNTYYIKSADSGLCIDIKVDSKDPVGKGSTLQAIGKKTEPNQQWAFSAVSGSPGYYWIQSIADTSLYIDIKENSNGAVASGSPLQLLELKKEANQYWMAVQGPSNQPTYFYLQSKSQSLNIGIDTSSKSEKPLQALTQADDNDQLWTLVDVTGNTYSPTITVPDYSNFPFGFNFSGSGFIPGALVSLSGSLTSSDPDDPPIYSSPTVFIADLGGLIQGQVFSSGGQQEPLVLTVTANYVVTGTQVAQYTININE